VESFTARSLREYFNRAYVAPNLVVSAAGNFEHARVRELVARAFASVTAEGEAIAETPPDVVPQVITRTKDLEQSHVCLGTNSYPQRHEDRYVSYILNTLLGGSMSSRLFQNVREKRGLAYSVFSGLSAYRDAGNITIYAGCASEAVEEVIDLCVDELRTLKRDPVPEAELRRAKDHLKGSLMLSLENTASRMSHLARQEIYFDRYFGLDETLTGVQKVTSDDVQRVAQDLFVNGSLAATVLGPAAPDLPASRLDLG
jgi:predicted Zn-dependent peptidase